MRIPQAARTSAYAALGAITGYGASRALAAYEYELDLHAADDPFLTAVQQHVGDDLVVGYALAVKTARTDGRTSYVTRWFGGHDVRLGLARVLVLRSERDFAKNH